jgi:hypothetical protein
VLAANSTHYLGVNALFVEVLYRCLVSKQNLPLAITRKRGSVNHLTFPDATLPLDAIQCKFSVAPRLRSRFRIQPDKVLVLYRKRPL